MEEGRDGSVRGACEVVEPGAGGDGLEVSGIEKLGARGVFAEFDCAGWVCVDGVLPDEILEFGGEGEGECHFWVGAWWRGGGRYTCLIGLEEGSDFFFPFLDGERSDGKREGKKFLWEDVFFKYLRVPWRVVPSCDPRVSMTPST